MTSIKTIRILLILSIHLVLLLQFSVFVRQQAISKTEYDGRYTRLPLPPNAEMLFQNKTKDRADDDRSTTELLHKANVAQTRRKGSTNSQAIAYAISVTHCPPSNQTYTVLEGAAVLGHSIHRHSVRNNASKYDYALFAFVYMPNENDTTTRRDCVERLEKLGYKVRILSESLPSIVTKQLPETIRQAMEEKGCCGSKEFLKLYVYTLIDYPIAVHLDTDTLIVRPMDPLWDSIIGASGATTPKDTSSTSTVAIEDNLVLSHFAASAQPHWPKDWQQALQSDHSIIDASRFDFFFTRDYHQQSQYSQNPKHYGIQGGFLIVRPNQTMFEELTHHILLDKTKTFDTKRGWNKKGYGGYWGAGQIQGYLAYVYGEYYPHRALELNRCWFNSMMNDDPLEKQKKSNKSTSNETTTARTCRTKEATCQDCRTTNWTDIYSIHLTTCRKPWECPYLREPTQPLLCRTGHRAWFEARRELELSWGQQPPTRHGWKPEWTLSYCSKSPLHGKKRFYLPMQLPTSSMSL